MAKADDVRIEYAPLAELERAPRNVKGHDLGVIHQSIDRFGYVQPILVNETTGRIVAGHGRLDTLAQRKEQGLDPPERVKVRADGEWLVPTIRGVAFADDHEAEAYLIADNRTVELGGWDEPALVEMLADLAEIPGGLDGVGYDADDIDAMLATLNAKGREVEDTRPPAVPENPETKPGDVWTLGEHRLICGDAREADTYARLLDGATINVAFTSPPYADRRKYDEASGFRPIPPDEYGAWFEPVQRHVAAHLARDGSWFVNIRAGANEGERELYVYDLVAAHAREWGWLFVDDLCWVDKNNGVPGGWPNRFKDAWEPVFHFARERDIRFRPYAHAHASDRVFDYSPQNTKSSTGSGLHSGSNVEPHDGMARPSNVITLASAHTEPGGHSAAFPVGLPAWFASAYSDPGDAILDPFCGSGSTILAAHQEKRVGYGIEISPAYCDVICARFERHTGIIPTRDGEPHDFASDA